MHKAGSLHTSVKPILLTAAYTLSGSMWQLPDDLEMRCIIKPHHLVIVGCHDPSAPCPWMEDLYGICDAVVIGRDSHAAHRSNVQKQLCTRLQQHFALCQ